MARRSWPLEIRLGDAQVAAFEASWLSERDPALAFGDSDDERLYASLDLGRGVLVVEQADADAVHSALVGLANLADEQALSPDAERELRRYHRRDEQAFSRLASRVLRFAYPKEDAR